MFIFFHNTHWQPSTQTELYHCGKNVQVAPVKKNVPIKRELSSFNLECISCFYLNDALDFRVSPPTHVQ